jgi:hypothetical protein
MKNNHRPRAEERCEATCLEAWGRFILRDAAFGGLQDDAVKE